MQWGDPYQAFVGDVHGRMLATGYGVYYPHRRRCAAAGAGAVGRRGGRPQLYAEVAAGHPVVVWVPHLMVAVSVGHWTAWDGRTVWYSPQEHTQVLVGYDCGASTVTLADPIDGRLHTYSMSLFENRFAAFMSSAVVITPAPASTWLPAGHRPGEFRDRRRRQQHLGAPPGTGTFGNAQVWSSRPFYGTRATLFADLDGPGKPSSAVAINDSSILVMKNNNGSGFGAPTCGRPSPSTGRAPPCWPTSTAAASPPRWRSTTPASG